MKPSTNEQIDNIRGADFQVYPGALIARIDVDASEIRALKMLLRRAKDIVNDVLAVGTPDYVLKAIDEFKAFPEVKYL